MVLDTHVWIWAVSGSKAMPEAVAHHLASNPSEVVLSAASIWEALLLAERGRLIPTTSPRAMVERWLRDYPIRVHPVEPEIIFLSRELPFFHSDPADRFIGATAYHLGLPLATSDSELRRLPWLQTL